MKKWLIILGVLFIIQIPFNLHYHAYYYATHMEDNNSKYYRFVPLLGNNYLPNSYVPGYKVTHKDLRGATRNDIQKIEKDRTVFKLHPGGAAYKDNNVVYYIIFGDKGEVDDTGNSKKHKRVTYRYLNDIENEIKQNSRRPIINLQWLWNVWYQVSN